jgi:hypothetical protein
MPLYKFSERAEKGDTHSPINAKPFALKPRNPIKKEFPPYKTDKRRDKTTSAA